MVTSDRAQPGPDRRSASPADPSRRRRRLTPDDRRAELTDAAIRLLRAGVDEGNWVAKVTTEADAAKGTFYAYFPSWVDMLATIRDRLLDDCYAPLSLAMADGGDVDWWGLLEGQCERVVDLAVEFARHHTLIFHSPLPGRSVEASRTGLAVLAEFIEAGTAAGAFRPTDTEVAATLLFAAIHTTADAVLEGGNRARWMAGWAALARGYLMPTVSHVSE